MKDGLKLTIAIFVSVLFVTGACSVMFPVEQHNDDRILTATVTKQGNYGAYFLDITIEDVRSIGADIGYDLELKYEDVTTTTLVIREYNGAEAGESFLNYMPINEYLAINFYEGSIEKELDLEIGDTMTFTTIGVNEYYPRIPHYTSGYSEDREDYDSDEAFGNYRMLTQGNIKEGLFYRSASPWTSGNRVPYINDYMESMGIENLVCLDTDYDKVKEYVDYYPDIYASKMYKQGKVTANLMSPAFFSNPEEISLFLENVYNTDGSICIFCYCGKDRTGVYCALLEGLAGATYSEIRDDFMLSLTNYYQFEYGSDEYNAVAEMYFERIMYMFNHTEIIDNLAEMDWDEVVFEEFDPEEVMTSFLVDYVGIPQYRVDLFKEKITAE